MSEYGTHVASARARAGVVATTVVDADVVHAILGTVPDPELPVVTIVELGMVHSVIVEAARIDVEVLPTFVGCPALEFIQAAIVEALAPLGRPVTVTPTFAVPWTSERITPSGRAALAAAGIAPPAEPVDVRCPHCASARVVMDSAFGPTPCRSLFYCRDCRQPFEAMKPV